MKNLNQYKLRAECMADLEKFIKIFEVANDDNEKAWAITRHKILPDCEMVLTTIFDLDTLKSMLALIPDGHVMLETIALLKDYTGERK
jgi:hypothetical protein